MRSVASSHLPPAAAAFFVLFASILAIACAPRNANGRHSLESGPVAPSLRLQIVEASGAPVHSLALFVSADGGEAEPGEHHAVDAVFTIEVAVHGSYFVWPAEPMAQLLDPSLGIDARVSTHAAGPAQLVLLRPAPPTACRSCSRSASVTTSRVR